MDQLLLQMEKFSYDALNLIIDTVDLDNAYSPQIILFAKQNPLSKTNVLYSDFFFKCLR